MVSSPNSSKLLTGTPEATFGNLSQETGQSESLQGEKKLRKELGSLLDATSRLTETLLKQPGVAQFIQANESLAILFKKPSAADQPPNLASSS